MVRKKKRIEPMASSNQPTVMASFRFPKGVNVADNVTLKLCPTNYFAWKQLMLTFLREHELAGFVDGTIRPKHKPQSPQRESRHFEETCSKEEGQMELKRLEKGKQVMDPEIEPKQREEWEGIQEEGESPHELDQETNSWNEEEERELSERERELSEREREREREVKAYLDWKRSDGLVTRWILATVTEEVLVQVIHLKTARDVWIKLERVFTPPFKLASGVELIVWTDEETGKSLSKYKVLHKAALTADWDAVRTFLDNNRDIKADAVFHPITWCHENALTVAVRSEKRNDFVMRLLRIMVRESMKQERTARMMNQDIVGLSEESLRQRLQMEGWVSKITLSMKRMEEKMMQRIQWREQGMKKLIKSVLQQMIEEKKREREKMKPEMAEEREKMKPEMAEEREQEMLLRYSLRYMEYIEFETQEREWRKWDIMWMMEIVYQRRISELQSAVMKGNESIDITAGRVQEFMPGVMGRWMDMDVKLLEQSDISGATALHAAVKGDNIEAAEMLLCVNGQLANIEDTYGTLPVHVAARLGNRRMVDLLLKPTTKPTTSLLENGPGLELLQSLASSGLYDTALDFLEQMRVHNRHLKFTPMGPSPLVVISQSRTSFLGGINLNFLQHLIYSAIPLELVDAAKFFRTANIEEPPSSVSSPIPRTQKLYAKLCIMFWNVALRVPHIKHIQETKLTHHHALKLVKRLCEDIVETDFPNAAELFTEPLRIAICTGIHEIIAEILESFPSAIHLRSEKDQSIFHLAIVHRRESVFNLIYQMEDDPRALLSMPDASTNNALHLAGFLAPQQQLLLRERAAGAALQMQRELQWFKEVEKWVLPQAKDHLNASGKTPQEVFTETHKDLVKEGEQWMKDTANSCTIVAALIVTIVFAAAITVPGGSYSDYDVPKDKLGLPIKEGNIAFTLFGIFDALALFSSSASLMMFLSILTSRYGEQDFLRKLPKRMIIGLMTLFISIISMMVAFGATLRIVLWEKQAGNIYLVTSLCSIPILLFGWLQFPLLFHMFKSTYFPGIFKKQSDRILY